MYVYTLPHSPELDCWYCVDRRWSLADISPLSLNFLYMRKREKNKIRQ